MLVATLIASLLGSAGQASSISVQIDALRWDERVSAEYRIHNAGADPLVLIWPEIPSLIQDSTQCRLELTTQVLRREYFAFDPDLAELEAGAEKTYAFDLAFAPPDEPDCSEWTLTLSVAYLTAEDARLVRNSEEQTSYEYALRRQRLAVSAERRLRLNN